jgi:uncharacterized protein (DUF1800 family)
VLGLPAGQVTNVFWKFEPSGANTTNDLINALNAGNLFVSLDSAKYPTGELRGNFVPSNATATFVTPAAPAALRSDALTAPTATDAARFLTQATFGPTFSEIAALQAQGITAWIDRQMALPATSQLAAIRADGTEFPNPPAPPTESFYKYSTRNRRAAWWKVAVTAPDQLRQRVAFALSELLVVGNDSTLQTETESLCNFYDIFVNNAFGSYRDILDQATLSPIMGRWLSHVQNQKADPVKGTSPDENYARELQQLFTIGLVQLHPDGTVMLDASGQPIPTYDQNTISETAKVLTGWAFAIAGSTSFTRGPPGSSNVNGGSSLNGVPADSGWINPMRYYDDYHDKTAKRIVSLQQVALDRAQPTAIPAGQTGPQDLKILLDTLFNHPNTPPFIATQLIQRLVTSNPSPGYVYRVAQAFINDGTGKRGNLGATVRAILTDYEARSPDVLNNAGYGKLKEPLLRLTALFRGLNVRAENGRYLDSYYNDPRGSYTPVSTLASIYTSFGQDTQLSPTVFNFFSPDYSPPGAVASAGLVAPEMEITDASFALTVPNILIGYIYRNMASFPVPASGPNPFLAMDFSALLPNAKNAAALVDQVNLLFCANQMTASTRTQIISTVSGLSASTTDTERVQTAVHLAVVSPDGAIQN